MEQELNVLIVDKDEQVIKFVSRLLNRVLEFVEISVAKDEATAVSYGANVDLAIIEIGRPLFLKTEDGNELQRLDIIRRLRVRQPHLTIIAISSYGDNAQGIAKSSGADFFVNNVYDSWKIEAIIKGINFR